MEAILNILDSYDAQDQCQLDVVHFGVGDVSENDVYMAETFAGNRSDAARPARTQPDGFVVILQRDTYRFPILRLLLLSGSIYGFNVGVSRSVQQAAAKRGVLLRLHSVIYKLMDELKEELSAKLPPLISKNVVGETHSA